MDTLNSGNRRNCETLSVEESDALFFPGVGNKSKRARLFCGTCPNRSRCLLDAIEQNLEGFWAGTTKQERNEMRDLRASLIEEVSKGKSLNLPKAKGTVNALEYLPSYMKRKEEGRHVRTLAPVGPDPEFAREDEWFDTVEPELVVT